VNLSSDYGASFSATTVSLNLNAYDYAMSDTGQYMACTSHTTLIVSTNYGSTWTTSLNIAGLQTNIHFNVRDIQIDMSSDGSYIIAFAGTLTFKNAPALREAVKLVPIDQLLVETDSPFLAPMPHRGSLNTPAQIPTILRFMADERGDDLDELATAISNNCERLFGSFA
jgi:Tat protein secretion system quality control protein TatD with DNase activity